jgi:YD repeat-containing protein
MKVIVFQKWDWNLDRGEERLDEDEPLPLSHAIAYLDWRGFPYRVVVKNPSEIRSLDSDEDEEFTYDYYYDDNGKIVEKRALDEGGNVDLIVRYEYDGERRIAEIGWSTGADTPPKRVHCKG